MIAAAPQSAKAGNEEPQQVREIMEKRDSNSKTYLLSNGEYEWVGYPDDIHYKDNNGEYKDVDNSTIAENARIGDVDYAYRNKANSYTARFASKASNAYLGTLEYQGKSISFGLEGAKDAGIAKPDKYESSLLAEMADPQNSVLYKDVYPGIDLVYQTTTHGIREYIVVNQPTDMNEFTFNLKMDGLSAKEEKGRVIFTDEKGEAVLEAKSTFAVDNNQAMTNSVACSLTDVGELRVTVDKAYMADEKRAYPIIIDPDFPITGSGDTLDTYASSRYPYDNYYLNIYLRTGRDTDYYVRQTYIKFKLDGAPPANTVTSAYMRLKKYSGATPNVTACRVAGDWYSNLLTWNNAPGHDSRDSTSVAYNDSGSWWRFNSTTLVQRWLNGTYDNYGYFIKDATESGTTQWTTFYSSDAPSPNKPELHIIYDKPEITQVEPAYGYLMKEYTYTFRAWVSGSDNPTVTFRYQAYGLPVTISETLNKSGSYFSSTTTLSNTCFAPVYYDNGDWPIPNGLFTATSNGFTDTAISSVYVCNLGDDYYSGIDTTFFYTNPTNSSFEGVATGYDEDNNYNCVAYVLNINNRFIWPWNGNPTRMMLDQFMSATGDYTGRAGWVYDSTVANNRPDAIYYSTSDWCTGPAQHIARVVSWDSNGYAANIISKWGDQELIRSFSADPFIYSSGYGAPVAYYKKI